MNPNLQAQIAQRVDRYLDTFSIARRILMVDRSCRDFSRIFKSANGTVVKSDKNYLLYESKEVNPHAFISEQKVLESRPKVTNQKHVPTYISQKSFSTFEDLEAEKLFTQMGISYNNEEEANIIKLIRVAFFLNALKYNGVNFIRHQSLKAALEEANARLKNKLYPRQEVKFNVLCNISLNLSDLHDEIEADEETGYSSYGDNTFLNCPQLNSGELYVMPEASFLGVMPIVEDVCIVSDKNKLITSYEPGMSVLNIRNIVKIEMPVKKAVVLGA